MEDWKYVLDRLNEVDKKYDNKFEEILNDTSKTLIQTTQTNGRVINLEMIVKKHEAEIESIKKVISFNKGRDYVVIALVGLLGGFIVSYILSGGSEKQINKIAEKEKIQNQIKIK